MILHASNPFFIAVHIIYPHVFSKTDFISLNNQHENYAFITRCTSNFKMGIMITLEIVLAIDCTNI